MLFSWISSFHSKEWTGPSITQINQKFNNLYAREIWGATNSNLRSGGPSLPGIEMSEDTEKNAWLSMIAGCTTHTVLTLNMSVLLARAWFRAIDWKRRTNVFINFHQLSLEVDLRIEGVKFPVRYSPIMAYTDKLRPKEVRFSGFRYMKEYIFHLLKYRGRKICHIGRC